MIFKTEGMMFQDPVPSTQDRQLRSATEYLRLLRATYPNYDTWLPNDFRQIDDEFIYGIRTAVAMQVMDAEDFMPRAFIQRYGQNAPAIFMQTIMAEADRRNIEDGVYEGMLVGAFTSHANITPEAAGDLVRDTTGPFNGPNGVVQTSPEAMLNYVMSSNMVAEHDGRAIIPRQAAEAFIAANPHLLPAELANLGIIFEGSDELAFDAGYMTRAGLSQDIAPLAMNYDPRVAMQTLPAVARDIFAADVPDLNVTDAWAAGWIAADMKIRNIQVAPRGITYASEDVMYGTTMRPNWSPPTTSGVATGAGAGTP